MLKTTSTGISFHFHYIYSTIVFGILDQNKMVKVTCECLNVIIHVKNEDLLPINILKIGECIFIVTN